MRKKYFSHICFFIYVSLICDVLAMHPDNVDEPNGNVHQTRGLPKNDTQERSSQNAVSLEKAPQCGEIKRDETSVVAESGITTTAPVPEVIENSTVPTNATSKKKPGEKKRDKPEKTSSKSVATTPTDKPKQEKGRKEEKIGDKSRKKDKKKAEENKRDNDIPTSTKTQEVAPVDILITSKKTHSEKKHDNREETNGKSVTTPLIDKPKQEKNGIEEKTRDNTKKKHKKKRRENKIDNGFDIAATTLEVIDIDNTTAATSTVSNGKHHRRKRKDKPEETNGKPTTLISLDRLEEEKKEIGNNIKEENTSNKSLVYDETAGLYYWKDDFSKLGKQSLASPRHHLSSTTILNGSPIKNPTSILSFTSSSQVPLYEDPENDIGRRIDNHPTFKNKLITLEHFNQSPHLQVHGCLMIYDNNERYAIGSGTLIRLPHISKHFYVLTAAHTILSLCKSKDGNSLELRQADMVTFYPGLHFNQDKNGVKPLCGVRAAIYKDFYNQILKSKDFRNSIELDIALIEIYGDISSYDTYHELSSKIEWKNLSKITGSPAENPFFGQHMVLDELQVTQESNKEILCYGGVVILPGVSGGAVWQEGNHNDSNASTLRQIIAVHTDGTRNGKSGKAAILTDKKIEAIGEWIQLLENKHSPENWRHSGKTEQGESDK